MSLGLDGVLALYWQEQPCRVTASPGATEELAVAIRAVLSLLNSKPAGVSGTLATQENAHHRIFLFVFFCLDTCPD